MLTTDDKKYILSEYLRNIHHISDKEYQRRAWINGEPPGTDFDEAVCQFADIGDPILENYQDFGITDDQYQILRKLRDKFGVFWEENGWPPEFIDTPEWNEIIEMAKAVLAAFSFQKKDSKGFVE
jgi:hypothetical protein